MSWSGWDGRGPNLRQEPTPEPAHPRFGPAENKRKGPRPWTIEWRHSLWRLHQQTGNYHRSDELGEWKVIGRYKTEEARDQALAKFMRVDHRPGRSEYRAGASSPASGTEGGSE